MGKFVKIKEVRYSKSITKKYRPTNEKSITLYFNSSRYKIESEIVKFDSRKSRDEVLNELDSHYLED